MVASWRETLHHWLDIQYRRAFNGVETADLDAQSVDRQYPARGQANPIWSVLRTLRQDPDSRPRFVPTRVPRPNAHLGFVDAVEHEHHLDVRERIEAEGRVGIHLGRVEFDHGGDGIPIVIDRRIAA